MQQKIFFFRKAVLKCWYIKINFTNLGLEESERKVHVENGDKEIIYSKAIKAGKRIYYLDVKKNLKNDLFLAITESKKIQPKSGSGNGPISFEKHKIFLSRCS